MITHIDRARIPTPGESCAGSPETAPATWAAFNWPEWIPESVRQRLSEFWSEKHGRSPRAWMESFTYAYARHPVIGTEVTCESDSLWGCRGSTEPIVGRWIPMWNNMGRVVGSDGEIHTRATTSILTRRPS